MSIREGDLRIDIIPLRTGQLGDHQPRMVRVTHMPTGGFRLSRSPTAPPRPRSSTRWNCWTWS